MGDRVRAPAPDLRGLSAAFAGGVLALHACARLPELHWLILLALLALIPWRGRAYLLAMTLGVLLSVAQAQGRLQDRWPAARHGEELTVRGHVSSLPERSAGLRPHDGPTLRFEFAPDDPALPSRIRVSWFRSEGALRGGECWTLRLKLRTPHGSLNPGAFDYEGWQYVRGIGATATVRTAEPCAATRAMPVLRARQALIDRLDAWLGAHPGKAMVAALTVGEDSGFSDAD